MHKKDNGCETFEKRLKELEENISVEAQILEGVVINEEQDLTALEELVREADVILLYKPYLGLGNCVIKIVGLGLPIILFKEEYKLNGPLDALEYVADRKNVLGCY
ncbi:hypothetical protein DRO59_09650 [Candidatus Bathyarchaeota archaeon]|nr:MAG: hypothetical protein DRO59_09650 [Candidatus Bathyarchaeota archaeon]